MAGSGIRILSLDGGGTRVLAGIYTLREIMNHVAPDCGGQIRPCEFFDLIGGSGPSGLAALLFAKFCLTIDEVIEYLENLSRRLDDLEDLRIRGRGNEVEEDDWKQSSEKASDPVDHLEDLRQIVMDYTWKDVIEANISDWLERFPYIENGEFNYKAPLAETDAGRARAAVVGSESPGYGGTSDDRQYNMPILHRTYYCRYGRTRYTFYAVGLGTFGAPDVAKPGVLFPDFLATGKHSVHNPTRLLIEEGCKLWPGLRIGSLISIGTGHFELRQDTWDFSSHSLAYTTAEACLKISNDNDKVAEEVKRFVLPFDKVLQSAYHRLDCPNNLAFFEHEAKDEILTKIKDWLALPQPATTCAQAAVGLRIDNFPATQEDQIALSSLASLLAALTTWGYAQEAKILSDVIANFMLYEGASGDGGSHRKVLIAVDSDWLACLVRNRQPCDKTNLAEGSDTEKMSPAFHLNSFMAFGSWKPQNNQTPLGELEFLSDIAAGAYCYLNIVRRGDSTEMQGAFWKRLVEQLSSLVGIVPEVSQSLTERIQVLLKLAALTSLCHAATVESLRGTKRLLYNGLLIRHLQIELENNSVEHISHRVLSPLCDMVSTLMRQGIWSQFRDEIVINLLSCTSLFIHDTWSVVNLAVERIRFGAKKIRSDESPVLAACKRVISETTARFNEDRDEVAKLSVERGYTGLLRKCLKNQLLEAFTPFNDHYPSEYTPGYVDSLIDRSGNSLMHHSARLGFPDILRVIIECLGMTAAKERINKTNAAGQSAAHLACIDRAPMDVFRLLWITRVNLNVRCNQGRTPLHYCFPDQNLLPEYHIFLMEMIETHSLPTTIPLDDSKAYGIYGKGQVIDTRAFDFRKIIHQLYCRNVDIRVQDQFGLTALHQAAKEGWGVNLDIFFTHTGGDSERLANDALRIEDNAGCTLLDYARMNGENGGENIILAEMRKRCMAIPQNVKIPTFRTSGRSDR